MLAWHKELMEDRERVENDRHDRRPWMRITKLIIGVIRDLFDEDKR